jgi:hypothetical protein
VLSRFLLVDVYLLWWNYPLAWDNSWMGGRGSVISQALYTRRKEEKMAKKHQQRSAKIVAGHNNPRKSTVITTGSYKKPETYQAQAARHENPGAQAQAAKAPPARDMSMGRTRQADSRQRIQDKETRSGSDSNAGKHRKGSEVHESNETKRQPQAHPQSNTLEHDYARDLAVGHRPAENTGMGGPTVIGEGFSANDFKELHTTLADLTDDELKRIEIIPTGTRLVQGSKYIDLSHLENGEFVASGDMVAEPGHYYVQKQDSDYVLWNRLNQVTNPARLDESDTQAE